MLAAIEYVLPLGRRCPLAREVSLLVGQRWAEVFPHAKHYRVHVVFPLLTRYLLGLTTD
jgi:hypothetical protein